MAVCTGLLFFLFCVFVKLVQQVFVLISNKRVLMFFPVYQQARCECAGFLKAERMKFVVSPNSG
jgi:hypothetical protein